MELKKEKGGVGPGLILTLLLVFMGLAVVIGNEEQYDTNMPEAEFNEILRYEVIKERVKRDREIRKAIIRESMGY